MADQENTATVTTDTIIDVAQDKAVRKVLRDMFADIQPRLGEEKTDLVEIFTPESASELLQRLTDLSSLLTVEDTFQETLNKFQAQIDKAEKVRDEVLAKLYKTIKPIEASYRQIWLFFENSEVPDGKKRKPVEFFVFNADPATMKNRESITLQSIKNFTASRNDNFNFRDDICNLVVSGAIPQSVREALEEDAYKWGMLLVTDLGDEKSFKQVQNGFRPGGKYEFLKRPDNKAACDVVTVGYLKLRDSHWFEQSDDDGIYAPASLMFAGAVARTDRQVGVVQGAIGTKFGQIKGVEKARVECLISEMELLSMEMQVLPIIRDADNHLCFYGCRSLAEDPYGVYKFFSSYRVLCYLERRISTYLREVAGRVLTRELMDEEIEKPLVRLMEEQKEQGTVIEYKLFVDKDANKRMQGICDIYMEVMPTGPAETFRIKIDVPEFKSAGAAPGSGGGS
jgi:hypothetical protein